MPTTARMTRTNKDYLHASAVCSVQCELQCVYSSCFVTASVCACRHIPWYGRRINAYVCTAHDTSTTLTFSRLLCMYVSRTHLDLYADESEAGVGPPVSCFYVSRLPHLPTYFEPRGHPQTETSNPNRPRPRPRPRPRGPPVRRVHYSQHIQLYKLQLYVQL